MKKIISSVLLGILLFFAPVVSAQYAVSNENIILQRDRVIEENYFAAGEKVTLSGTVNGDAYIAGGNLLVDGIINGDIMIAGGSVNIDGVVDGDLRVAGGQVNIAGEVRGNVTALGGSVTIAKSAIIGDSLVAGAGQLTILAPITRGATFGAGSATIGSNVGGNVLAATETLTLTPNASVQGRINYYSKNRLDMQEGSRVAGGVNFTPVKADRQKIDTQQTRRVFSGFILLVKALSALTALILGWIIIHLFPVFSRHTIQAVESQPLPTILAGFLGIFVIPVLVLALFMTVIGVPVGLMLLAIYFIYIYVSKIFFALFVGKKISEWLNIKQALFAYLFIGLIAWIILTSLPFVGWLFGIVSLFLGTGSLLLTKRYYATSLREKKLV